MADVDLALEQQVLHVPQGEREAHVHQHDEADHLGRGVEALERGRGLGSGPARHAARLAAGGLRCHVGLTEPMTLLAALQGKRTYIAAAARADRVNAKDASERLEFTGKPT